MVHDRLCKCSPNNTLPPITQRPFPVPPSDPIVASPTCSSSGLSYADVPIQGEDIDVGASTSGPSSDPGFVPFAPTVPSSSAPTTTGEAPRSQETPSPFTVQEDELIALEEEDKIMREDLERRMNAPERTRPGGVRQGRFHASKSINSYPHKMALGRWNSQHATEFCKRRSVKQGGRRGRPVIVPGDRGNEADNSRTGGSSGAAEKVALLPAFDPSDTTSSDSGSGHDQQGGHRGSIGLGEPSGSLLGLGSSGADHGRGGGPVLGASESRCCRASG